MRNSMEIQHQKWGKCENSAYFIWINCGLRRLLPFRNPRLGYPDLYVNRGFYLSLYFSPM